MAAYIADPAASIGRFRLAGANDVPVQTEASRLLDDIKSALDVDLAYAAAVAKCLAALLAKSKSSSTRAGIRTGLAAWQKRKVDRFIDENLETAVAIEDLASLVSLSYSHFCRLFKETFGLPPHTYLIKRRVERAKALVNTTSESLAQIALLCGFADQAHFGRRFRQHVGVTPAVWRRHRVS